MGRDGVDTGLLPEVPQSNGIVVASSCHVVTVGTEIHGQNTLQVSVQ